MSEHMQTWRVWFSADTGRWCAGRWDGKGGVCTAATLEVRVPFITEGKFMRMHAEAKINAANWIENNNIDVEVLRMMPVTQTIEVPPIRSRTVGGNI